MDIQEQGRSKDMIARTLTAIRRNIVAWLALFVALTGTSMAASHYIITSTHQIKPSVLKQLRGARGGQGPAGLQGATGKEGSPGKEGTAGKTGLRGETGPEGKGTPGSPGEKGKDGEKGEKGEAGAPGTAVAFAHITAAGSAEPEADSKSFTGATVTNPPGKEGEGIYCISGLSVPLHNVVVTIDNKESEEPFWATATLGESAYLKAHKTLCSSPQITVETGSFSGSKKEPVTSNAPFFISIN